MSSFYGENLRFTIFGQSHSKAIGVTIEGIPAGFSIDFAELQRFLNRRAPGRSATATARKEVDLPEFLSGLVDGVTCGAPITAIIPNTNIRPQDYQNLKDCPRPGHADFTAQIKFHGYQDSSGGGHFSGRLTAPLCVVGGICLQLLKAEGITIAAHIGSIGPIKDSPFDPVSIEPEFLRSLTEKPMPLINDSLKTDMENAILQAKSNGDSVGGIVECAAVGLPAGLGDPMFGGMENRISQAVFGIPAVRGIEFGSGFAAAEMLGSQHNDPYYWQNGQVRTRTNHHGGILGGITSGMPLLFRTAFKPTPSIAQAQQSVNLHSTEEVSMEITGRHDPCIVPRAVPCVEAAAAVAIYDALLQRRKER